MNEEAKKIVQRPQPWTEGDASTVLAVESPLSCPWPLSLLSAGRGERANILCRGSSGGGGLNVTFPGILNLSD
jgi:hypothetical protein